MLGDHFFVERAFSLAAFALNGVLIAAIWRLLLPPRYDWLPVLIWLVPSVVTWAVINNMLENVQAVFTSFACYALLRLSLESSGRFPALWAGSAGVAVVAATLTKGPVGLFPLALPLLLPLLWPRHRVHPRPAVWMTVVMVVAVAVIALFWADRPRHSLAMFMNSHLAPALGGERGVGPRAHDISRHLTHGIWLRMAVVAGLIWLAGLRRRPVLTTYWQVAFFFALGCAASLPILFSPVLAGHYFFPSMPIFALAFGALALDPASSLAATPGRPSWRVPVWGATAVSVAVVAIVAIRGPLEIRNAELVRDLDAIRSLAPVGQTVGACPASSGEWGLLNYAQRFYRISLYADGAAHNGWFLQSPGQCAPPPACQSVSRHPSFDLFSCPAADGR